MASEKKANFTAAEEEAIIKARVLTQTAPVKGEAPYKRLTKKFIALVDEAEKGSSPELLEKAYQSLLRDISLQEVQADKYDTMLLTNDREQQRYADTQQELTSQIQQAEADIQAAKAELEQAKIVRQQHEEYEILRHVLMKHPSRATTQREIDRVEAAIQKIKQEGERAATTMQRRRQQFALLFHVIEELQRTIEDTTADGAGADNNAMDVDA